MSKGTELVKELSDSAQFWGWKNRYGDRDSQNKAFERYQKSFRDLEQYVLQLERRSK